MKIITFKHQAYCLCHEKTLARHCPNIKAALEKAATRRVLSPLLQKLIRRIETECDLFIPNDVTLQRTRAGRHQRACGAWSWRLYGTCDGIPWELGGYEPIRELIKRKRLVVTMERGSPVLDGED